MSNPFSEHAPISKTNNPRKARLAPLVTKVQPNTVVGRQPLPQQRVKNERFIQPVQPRMSTSGEAKDDKFIINGHESYFLFVKEHPELLKEPDVESFVKLIESIPKACGCVHGQLREQAASVYARMLPMLQAKNPDLFESIKKAKGVKTLVFKEKDIVLFEV